MIYTISIRNLKVTRTFIKLLVSKFKVSCLFDLDKKQVKRLNTDLYHLLDVEIDYIKLLTLGINKVKYRVKGDMIFFIIPNTIKYPKTEFRVADLLKITEFGTLQIKPYPIIRKTLIILQKNLKMYLKLYKLVGWF